LNFAGLQICTELGKDNEVNRFVYHAVSPAPTLLDASLLRDLKVKNAVEAVLFFDLLEGEFVHVNVAVVEVGKLLILVLFELFSCPLLVATLDRRHGLGFLFQIWVDTNQ